MTQTTASQAAQPVVENDYDTVPYVGYPYAQSHPHRLRAVAKLFGLNAPEIASARVLELGCASGDNIFPIALSYPQSQCVGVDFSVEQIKQAKKQAEQLSLTNMRFEHMSIEDISPEFGEFDYIIVHGVYSWVPDAIRDKIIQICRQNLSQHGVAYVSYNTLPGWNMVRTIRDMMLYHVKSQGFSDEAEKVQQARAMLQFIVDSNKGNETPYSNFLTQEVELLANQPDSYLRHDHMESNNTPVYFSDFMQQAASHGLQYVGDTNIGTMYVENLQKDAAEVLRKTDNLIRQEQYMDFIGNRRFRSSILCRNDVILNRNLSTDQFKSLGVRLSFDAPAEVVALPDAPAEVVNVSVNNGANNLSTASPIVVGLMKCWSRYNSVFVSVEQLCTEAADMLEKADITQTSAREAVLAELLSRATDFVMRGVAEIADSFPEPLLEMPAKPCITALVRHQIAQGMDKVTTRYHHPIGLSQFDIHFLPMLDGAKDMSMLLDAATAAVADGFLSISKEGAPVTEESEVREILAGQLPAIMKRYLQWGVIEPSA